MNTCKLIRQLLVETTDTYDQIVEKVKVQFPDAKTTRKSVASIACDLKKTGAQFASRVKVKQVQLELAV